MSKPNKGTTFRAICRVFNNPELYLPLNIGNKDALKEWRYNNIAAALKNAQIRHGELPSMKVACKH